MRSISIPLSPLPAVKVPSKTKDTYIVAQYRRIAARRGKKRALVAHAHTILVMISQILTKREAYQELGPDYFDEQERHHLERRLVRRLERLGDDISLQSSHLLLSPWREPRYFQEKIQLTLSQDNVVIH